MDTSNTVLARKRPQCLICGKRLSVTIYKDRHYTGAHYFNKIKVPIGKGEYKKIRMGKLFGRSYTVVEWTGKEREVEYWECNACFASD